MNSWRGSYLKRQDGACFYCHIAMTIEPGRGHEITRDHRQPKSRGGSSSYRNKVGACHRCNNLKGSLTEAEFRATFSTPEIIEEARPMAVYDAQRQRAYNRSKARGAARKHPNPEIQRTIDAIAAGTVTMPKGAFRGQLVALDKDGKEVAVFHPKEK